MNIYTYRHIVLLFCLGMFFPCGTSHAQNLLMNGNFEMGGNGVGFNINSSAYNEINPLTGTTVPGNYAVVTDPQPMNTALFLSGGDHTTGTGKMLAVDATTTGGQQRFWRAGSSGGGACGLVVGETYTFRYWIKSISTTVTNNATRANIGIQFNNASNVTLVTGSAMAPLPSAGWQEVVYTFVSTNYCVNIEMYDTNTNAVGNDFAVDDFELLAPAQPLTANYTVFDNLCLNGQGFIAVYPSGGVSPYTIALSGPVSETNTDGIFENLPPGTYTAVVTDSQGISVALNSMVVDPESDLTVTDDIDICLGESLALSVTGGSGTYSWVASPPDPTLTDPTSATPTVSPSQTTTYTVTDGTASSLNLIVNGDFESGNSSFFTHYTYTATNPSGLQRFYGIVNTAQSWYSGFPACADHSGTGKMFVMDGSTVGGGVDVVWGQTVPVTPNTTYTFTYYIQSLSSTSPAQMRTYINGALLGSHTASNTTCLWQQVSYTWNSGPASVAQIILIDNNTAGIGNDVSLDDISMFQSISCNNSETVTVTVNNPESPVITCSSSSNAVSFNWTPVSGATEYTISYSINAGAWVSDTTVPSSYTVGSLSSGDSVDITVVPMGSGCYASASLSCSISCVSAVPATFNALEGCQGESLSFPTTSLEGFTGTWSPATIEGSVVGTSTYTFTPDSGLCASSGTLSVTVSMVPALTALTAATPVCSSSSAVFSIEGTAGSTVSYSLNGGGVQTLVLDASGQGTVEVPSVTSDQSIALVGISLGSCSQSLLDTAAVSVVSQPAVASLTAATPVCSGSSAVFSIEGTAGSAVSYSLNGGGVQTLVLDASGQGTVEVPSVTSDQSIQLLQVDHSGCSTALNQSASVMVIAYPTLTGISDTGPVCTGNTVSVTFTGTPSATVVYTVDGGAIQSMILDVSGQGILQLTPSNNVVVHVSEIGLGDCTTVIDQTHIVQVHPLPQVTSFSANANVVCQGEQIVFSIEGSPGAVVSYVLDGVSLTDTLNAAGVANVTVSATLPGHVMVLQSVSNTATGCVEVLTDSVSVTVMETPTATLDVLANTLCSGGSTTLTFTGTPGVTVTFTDGITTQTVTLSTSGTANYPTGPISQDMTYSLISAAWGTTPSCVQPLVDSETITINQVPSATLNFSDVRCDGEVTDVSVALSNASGYIWTAYISNIDTVSFPYTISGDETISMNQAAHLLDSNAGGTVRFEITPVLAGSDCQGQVQLAEITILPVAQVSDILEGDLVLCSGESVHLEIQGSPSSNVQFNWTVHGTGVVFNGPTSGSTVSTIDITASVPLGQLSPGTLYVEVTPVTLDASGNVRCTGIPSTSSVFTFNPQPTPVAITTPIAICSGESASLSVQPIAPAVPGTVVYWQVDEVSGVSGASPGSASASPYVITDIIETTGVTQGFVRYEVWTEAGGCKSLSVYLTVYVDPLPEPYLHDAVICIDSSGVPTQPVMLQVDGLAPGNYTFTWYNTNDPNPIAVTSASALQVTVAGSYYVEVQGQNGCHNLSNTAAVTQIQLLDSISVTQTDPFTQNATLTVTVSGGSGSLLYQLDDGPMQTSHVFSGVSNGEHAVTVMDSGGCSSLTTTVMVIGYPVYFTPNGDGIHDYWNVIGLNQATARLFIFDRYGKLLKQLSPVGMGWDGTYNGARMPSSDYWFLLEYQHNGTPKEFRAHFSLKR